MDEIALNDAGDEEDEDPLAEEPSSDQDDPLEPTLMDLVEHQDLDDAALDEGLVSLQPLPPVRGHRNIVRPDSSLSATPIPDHGMAVDLADDLTPAPAPPPALQHHEFPARLLSLNSEHEPSDHLRRPPEQRGNN